MSPARRAGVTVTEIMVAITILAVGMFPIFSIYRGARLGIGISRSLVELQDEAHALLAAAKARLRTGELLAEAIDGEVVQRVTNGDLKSTVTISSSLRAGRLLTIRVRTEGKRRYYEAYQVVSDPFGPIAMASAAEEEG